MSAPPLLACRDLVKRFGDTTAVAGASLDVPEGALVALVGPSGCGKTTLLRLIAGFETPDGGTIQLRGEEIASPSSQWPPERRHVAMVFQDFALFPHLDVAANIAFGLPRGVDRKARVRELLALVRLDGLERRMPHALSGGQQQRVALARAFAANPDLILMDEPFSNLDPSVRDEVRYEVRRLLATVGVTAILVTHDQEEALSFAGQVAVMMEGRVVQVGSPAEVYGQPVDRAVGAFLGRANVLAGRAHDGTVSCALGWFPVPGTGTGAVDVLFRAEALGITDNATPGGGAPGEVEALQYYGHDQMILVRLAGGERVYVRQLSGPSFTPGQRVGVVARGTPLVFPRG